ncbi:MAG: GNAT family N-acetyltransferase, partial [Sciscionella sp.]
ASPPNDNSSPGPGTSRACGEEFVMAAATTTGHATRPYTQGDRDQVLAVIDADRLPGQPVATGDMLAEALVGRSPVDGGWWSELDGLRTDVLTDPTGAVAGAVSYARRPRDGAGVVLWLHGGEDSETVRQLTNHALAGLAGCPVVEAFSFASALGLGLEALPVRHRPVTDRVLREAGFRGENLWRYMHRPLPVSGLPRASTIEVTTPDEHSRQLTMRDREQVLAEATIGLPVAGIGVLWWISVEPAGRGKGLGRALLGSALELLVGLDAAEVILFVDDDEPGTDRDRTAANRLYDSAGFREIDRLYSYQLLR